MYILLFFNPLYNRTFPSLVDKLMGVEVGSREDMSVEDVDWSPSPQQPISYSALPILRRCALR